jgi:hypothetical protein
VDHKLISAQEKTTATLFQIQTHALSNAYLFPFMLSALHCIGKLNFTTQNTQDSLLGNKRLLLAGVVSLPAERPLCMKNPSYTSEAESGLLMQCVE